MEVAADVRRYAILELHARNEQMNTMVILGK